MKLFRNLLAALGLLLLCVFGSCAHTPEPPPAPPDPVDPPPLVVDCASACENQFKLGCTLGKTTKEGSTCLAACQNTLDGPPDLQWDLACLTTARACSACVRR